MIGITIAYIVLATLILWFIIGAKGMWFIKFFAIAAALYLGAFIHIFINKNLGYAVEDSLPQEFEVYCTLVNEPVSIFFLISNESQPRLYKLPYSRPIHEKAVEIQDMLKKGKRVLVKTGKDGDGEGGKRNSGEAWKGHKEMIFYELPPGIP